MSIFTTKNQQYASKALTRLDKAYHEGPKSSWDAEVMEIGGEKFTADDVRSILSDVHALMLRLDNDRHVAVREYSQLRAHFDQANDKLAKVAGVLIKAYDNKEDWVKVSILARALGSRPRKKK